MSRTPEGLLKLLGTNVGGRYPTGFADSAVATVDIGNLLAARTLATETAVGATSAFGDTADLVVPENEVWVLKNISTQWLSTASNTRLDIHVLLTNLPASTVPANEMLLMSGLALNGLLAIHSNGASRFFDDPLVLSPGTIIRGEIADQNSATIIWGMSAGIYRLTA